MQVMSLIPVVLPMTDVLTGLQTGLIDIVAIPPVVGLVLQWHTKVKYVTRMPLVYSFGFMAIDKKSFDQISDDDQSIIREVMSNTYLKFDRLNQIDNQDAFDALVKSGIEEIEFDAEELVRIRDLVLVSNLKLGSNGAFTLELYEEMLRHIDEFRSEKIAAGN